MDKNDNKPIQFYLLKVNRGRKKICQCKPAHYEIDVENRIVTCMDCGAVVDPFDALLSVAHNYEIYQKDIGRLREKVKVFADEANKEFNRMRRNRAFRQMAESCKNDMLPHCPECGKVFDPANITSWTNRNFVKEGADSNE